MLCLVDDEFFMFTEDMCACVKCDVASSIKKIPHCGGVWRQGSRILCCGRKDVGGKKMCRKKKWGKKKVGGTIFGGRRAFVWWYYMEKREKKDV